MDDQTSVSIEAFVAGPVPQQQVVLIYLNKASLATIMKIRWIYSVSRGDLPSGSTALAFLLFSEYLTTSGGG